MQKRDHLLFVFGQAVRKAHSHTAEPDGRDFQIALSKFALFHFLNPFFEFRSLFTLHSSLITGHSSLLILFVTDLLHPIDRFAVQRFLNGDMSHRGRRRSAVPMLFTRREPDHIPGQISYTQISQRFEWKW